MKVWCFMKRIIENFKSKKEDYGKKGKSKFLL